MKKLYIWCIATFLLFLIFIIKYKERNIEGFAILTALKTFAKAMNNIRKFMNKIRIQIFDRIKKIYRRFKKVDTRMKKLKKWRKKIKKMKKIKDLRDKLKAKYEAELKKQMRGEPNISDIFAPIIAILKNNENSTETRTERIKKLIDKGPSIIIDIILAPIKNIKDHFTIKNGITYMLFSTMVIIIAVQFSTMVSEMIGFGGNIIINNIFNFILIFIISYNVLKIYFKSKCKKDNKPMVILPIKKNMYSSAFLTFQILLLYTHVANSPIFGFLNSLGENMPIFSKLLKIKDAFAIGIIYFVLTLLNKIPNC